MYPRPAPGPAPIGFVDVKLSLRRTETPAIDADTMSCSAPLRTTCRIFPVRQRPPHMPRSASSGMDILASVSSLARAHEVENNWRPVTVSQVPRYTNPAHLQARGCVRGRSTGEVDAKSGRPT